MADGGLASDINAHLMDTDAFEIGLDPNEPAPAVLQKESYEEVMGFSGGDEDDHHNMGHDMDGQNVVTGQRDAKEALGKRLVAFREWLEEDANVKVHPNLCIVNGEATDGTKNAPVLSYVGSLSGNVNNKENAGRCGLIDREVDRVLYDRTMGCQLRTAREIKKDDTLMEIPKTAFVTPDVVAASDAGRAVLACIEAMTDGPNEPSNTEAKGDGNTTTTTTTNKPQFWDSFEGLTDASKRFEGKVASQSGTQLLVRILQERKKAEAFSAKAAAETNGHYGAGDVLDGKERPGYTLAKPKTVSSLAPLLVFLIHQRFYCSSNPAVVGEAPAIKEELKDEAQSAFRSASTIDLHENSPSTFSPYVRTFPSAVTLPMCWKRNELAPLASCGLSTALLREVARMTLRLAHDFMTLIHAGILHRFPSIFPRGLLTWDKWMWAASVYLSRAFPVEQYLNEGEKDVHKHSPGTPQLFQSPSTVWKDLGVMIPMLDMANHETDAAQMQWHRSTEEAMNGGSAEDGQSNDVRITNPRATTTKRIKKHSQLYFNYGAKDNKMLILKYGIGQMSNPRDHTEVGWGLTDGVGQTSYPADYEAPFDFQPNTTTEGEPNDTEMKDDKVPGEKEETS